MSKRPEDTTDEGPHLALLDALTAATRYSVALLSKPSSATARVRVSYGPAGVILQGRERGNIQLECGRSSDERRSTGTREWASALKMAEEAIREQIKDDHTAEEADLGVSLDSEEPCLLPVIGFYRRERFTPTDGRKRVSDKHRSKLERVWAIVHALWGHVRPLSWYNRDFVAKYIQRRTSKDIPFPPNVERRPCRPVKMRVAVSELKDFAGALAYAKRMGRIKVNPLEGYPWNDWLAGDEHAVEHMEEAHIKRHSALLKGALPGAVPIQEGEKLAPIHRVNAWDQGIRARGIEAAVFHTGHRITSVLALDCEDVGFTQEEVRALLARTRNHREWWAEHWQHGAIRWKQSKESYLRVTPMPALLSQELSLVKASHPGWRPGMPVFTQMKDPRKRLVYDQTYKWTRQAIQIAREHLLAQGHTRAEVDRWLAGAVNHGWRDHWATLMDQLGYGWDVLQRGAGKRLDLHNHVAFLGDWAMSGGTQAEVYVKLNPGILLAVAEFRKADEVIREFSAVAETSVHDVLSQIYGAA